ncbi:class IIb bacteriocin, lactobin A/cerein 7B family [Aquimarina longa]|uniref:class IIb bacteriocin, lactobin A/cerein 7B family n=1 Tax=Aquimarina longa TaxID=1080221 RepID=UPI000784FB23|nr:class IIb bacteriocin, lactobin A/cerein 7B family [Aquimarina longa]
MRVLKNNEVEEVNGGVIPIIIATVLVDIALIAVTAGAIAGAQDQAAKSKHIHSKKGCNQK